MVELYKEVYTWLENFLCEKQSETDIKHNIYFSDKDKNVFIGDTLTSIWTSLKNYINLKTGVNCIFKNYK